MVVVTGGSTGIGKEVAALLAERSRHPVAVLDLAPLTYSHPSTHHPSRFHRLRPQCTHRSSRHQVLQDQRGVREEFAEVAARVRAETGEPTIVVNNAGIAVGRTIVDTPSEVFSRVIGVNTLANVYAASYSYPICGISTMATS